MKLTDIQKVVLEILSDDEECRYNEPLLIAKALKRYNLPTDLFKLAEITCKDYPGAIGRTRRKVQEMNPTLVDRYAKEKRQAMEEKFKEYAKQ